MGLWGDIIKSVMLMLMMLARGILSHHATAIRRLLLNPISWCTQLPPWSLGSQAEDFPLRSAKTARTGAKKEMIGNESISPA